MTPEPPAPISRRLLFRALADCLGGQARHFAAPRYHPGRPSATPAVAAGRADRAARLRSQCDEIGRWIGDPARYQGPGIDAAVLGYLVALAYGHTEALPELAAELADLGRPGLLEGLGASDLVEIVRRITT